MTSAFLEFSKSRGNDLSTPQSEFGFPGLKPGDRWCLCAPRWQEAFEANQAPRVVLRATHEGALAQNASPWTWRDSQRGRAWDRISVNDAWMKRSNFARSHPIPQPAVQVRMCGKADVADIDAREQAGK
jgi:hypothetical protein